MGYWGWRPLALTVFICVLVAGCNLANDASPSSAAPTPYPNITLTVGRPAPPRTPTATPRLSTLVNINTPVTLQTEPPPATPVVYTVQEGDTLLDIAIRFDVSLDALRAVNSSTDLNLLQVGQTLIIPANTPEQVIAEQPSPTPLSLVVQPPTCYETQTGTTLCLGKVDNPQETPAGRVALEVRLLRQGWADPLVEIATIEQSLILSGRFAPYRVVFDIPWREFTGASAVLQSADASYDSTVRALVIENQRAELVDGSFTVTADLVNSDAQTVQPIRAIITLQNSIGEVIGYRVAPLENAELASGQQMSLHVDLIPQVYPSSPLSVSVYAEARVV